MPRRPSPTRPRAFGAAAGLLLGLGALGAAADPLVIEADGVVRIGPPAGEPLTVERDRIRVGQPLSFGYRLGALMTLYEPGYSIGVQLMTMYFRSDRGFAWYRGGGHADAEQDGGGGLRLMSLSAEPAAGRGTLDVAGTVTATGLSATGPIEGTGLTATGTITGQSLGISLGPRIPPGKHLETPDAMVYVTGDLAEGAPGEDHKGHRIEFRHSNGTQGVGISYNTLYATGSNANQPLKLAARGDSPVMIAGNGDLTVPGRLTLGGGWSIVTDNQSMAFRHDNRPIMIANANERLQYSMPGEGLHYLASWTRGWAWWDSDARLKEDIARIPGALERVRGLSGVRFRWNADAVARLGADLGPDAAQREAFEAEMRRPTIGVIAQEVETALPEAVKIGADGYRSVNYRDLIPLLIEAAKEQDAVVAAQAARLAALEARLAALAAQVEALTAAAPTPTSY